MLTDEQIQTFQTLYKERFDIALSKQEALEKGLQLVRLVELTYKPLNDNYQKQYGYSKQKDRTYKNVGRS